MKNTLTLLFAAALGLGALPTSTQAATIVVSTGSSYGHRHHYDRHDHYRSHRRSHTQYRSAHWEYRHGHRYFVPARRVVVYF